MSVSFVLITFLTQMAAGMMITISLLPPAEIDHRFFRSISFWCMVFVGLALLTIRYSTFSLPGVFGMGGEISDTSGLLRKSRLLFFGFFLLSALLWARLQFLQIIVSRIEVILISLVGLVAIVTHSLAFRPALPPLWVQNVLIPLHFISTGMILGAFLTGMIFGHFYLVNTDMPKKLLLRMAWILIAVLALRIVSVGTTLLLHHEFLHHDMGTEFLTVLTSFAGHGIFFWQRILVGLAIPAVVVGLIWGTARIGSNQSATGIMYVAISFVFIGELVARYLFLLSAIPL